MIGVADAESEPCEYEIKRNNTKSKDFGGKFNPKSACNGKGGHLYSQRSYQNRKMRSKIYFIYFTRPPSRPEN
jgi:hypothetical protein